MHLNYPVLFVKSSFDKSIDDNFVIQGRNHKYDCVIDLDMFLETRTISVVGKIYCDTQYVYRGYMLTVDEYTDFYHKLNRLGIQLINSPRQYANAHCINNWLDKVQNTAFTSTIPFYPCFVKDQVKSIGKQSVCNSPLELEDVHAKIKQSRRVLELPFVYRQLRNYKKEIRVFYLNGYKQSFAPFDVEIYSNFYTVDYGIHNDCWEVIEIGDGQVSEFRK